MKFEVYEDNKGEWRWRLKATNGQIIATSGEGYVEKSSCEHSIGLIIAGAATTPIAYL